MPRNYNEQETCMYCNQYRCCCGEEGNTPQFLGHEPEPKPKAEDEKESEGEK